MIERKKIAQKRYSLKEALGEVPNKDLKRAKEDICRILGVATILQIWYYTTGKSQPTLPEAREVEEYFDKNWGIKNVWREIDA